MTPAKGDYASVPLNPEGGESLTLGIRRRTSAKAISAAHTAPATSCASRNVCISRGRTTIRCDGHRRRDADSALPLRRIEMERRDASMAGRFGCRMGKASADGGAAGRFGGAEPGKGGTLHVVTTHMRPGYLRKNGVPYSGECGANRILRPVRRNGVAYLIVTSVVDDPQYLNDRFITADNSSASRMPPSGIRRRAARYGPE